MSTSLKKLMNQKKILTRHAPGTKAPKPEGFMSELDVARKYNDNKIKFPDDKDRESLIQKARYVDDC